MNTALKYDTEAEELAALERTHFFCAPCDDWHELAYLYCDEAMMCKTAYYDGSDPCEDLVNDAREGK